MYCIIVLYAKENTTVGAKINLAEKKWVNPPNFEAKPRDFRNFRQNIKLIPLILSSFGEGG